MILDNCDEVLNKQGDEFHDAIMKIVQESLNVKVMVTSRRVATFTKYYKWFKVKELTMAAACELLDRKIPTKIKLSLEEKEQIANLTGNVPLALQIIGSLLHLPNSPLPCVIIRQLKEELILTLSSKDLPRQEQAYASISISYRYLSEEMQVGGHQLTIFPGSFNQEAVTGIFFFNTTTQCDQYQYFAQKSYELTSFLVRSSLLEHNERTNRYRYHILIKQYFLLLQQKEKSLNTTKHMPAFHVHYAKQLAALSRTFPNFPDDSLAFLDLEHHNIQFLLMHTLAMKPDSKSSILTEEFLETTIALSTAIDMSLLDLRFTRKTLCKLVQHALTQFDKVVHHLELYLQLSRQNFTQKEALNVYLRLINQQATCEQELHGVQRAVKVYTHRRHIIKSKNGSVDFKEYINFFMKLSNYFRQLGFDTEVAECHRIIIQRTKTDLEMCKPNQCNYYDIGQAYYAMNRYEDAAKFFEMSYETESHTMNKAAAVVRLAHTYNKLNDHGRENETIAKLHEIYSCITDAFLGSDLTIDGEAVQIVIIDLFRKAGFEAEANHLEIKFIGSYNNIIREMNVTTTKHSDCCCNTKCIPVTSNHLLTRGVNVLRHLNKQENFTQVIELGTFLRGNIQGSNSLEYYLLIEVSLLIGKAKYYTVSYSQGMDEMEHALQTILDQPGYYTWTQMSTACYYLIPRLVYIDTCYHFSTVLKDVIHVIIYLLFSPYPLNLGKPEDNQNNQSISEKTDIISHTTELATIGGPLSTVLNPLWSHYQKLTQSTTESVQKVYLSFDNLLGPLVKLKNMLNAPMCVLVTWAKLMLYCTLFFLSEEQIVFTMLPILEIFQFIILFATNPSLIMHIRPIMRYARDPRYRYGDDSSIYIGKIDMIMRDSLI